MVRIHWLVVWHLSSWHRLSTRCFVCSTIIKYLTLLVWAWRSLCIEDCPICRGTWSRFSQLPFRQLDPYEFLPSNPQVSQGLVWTRQEKSKRRNAVSVLRCHSGPSTMTLCEPKLEASFNQKGDDGQTNWFHNMLLQLRYATWRYHPSACSCYCYLATINPRNTPRPSNFSENTQEVSKPWIVFQQAVVRLLQKYGPIQRDHK